MDHQPLYLKAEGVMARKKSQKESLDLLDRVHLVRLEFMRRDPDYKRDYEKLFPLSRADERSDHVALRKKYGLSRLEVMPPPLSCTNGGIHRHGANWRWEAR